MVLDVGVELGGTKVVVASSMGGCDLEARVRIDTGEPEPTLAAVRDAITDVCSGATPAAIGIATFGPVDLRLSSPEFGTLARTPKPGWSGVDVVGSLAHPGVTVGIDTDVGAAVRAEHRWGAAGTRTAAYLTIGTGIGGAIWADGDVIRGANHSEAGHLSVPRHPHDDFVGSCPYHGACLEGMASGPALAARFGSPTEDLGGDDAIVARDLAAFYVGRGILDLVAIVPVQTVVIGGGVSHLDGFHDAVAAVVGGFGAGYPPIPVAEGGPVIAAPGLGDDAGVLGAIELARRSRSGSAATR